MRNSYWVVRGSQWSWRWGVVVAVVGCSCLGQTVVDKDTFVAVVVVVDRLGFQIDHIRLAKNGEDDDVRVESNGGQSS